jgi:hypothetical protein
MERVLCATRFRFGGWYHDDAAALVHPDSGMKVGYLKQYGKRSCPMGPQSARGYKPHDGAYASGRSRSSSTRAGHARVITRIPNPQHHWAASRRREVPQPYKRIMNVQKRRWTSIGFEIGTNTWGGRRHTHHCRLPKAIMHGRG